MILTALLPKGTYDPKMAPAFRMGWHGRVGYDRAAYDFVRGYRCGLSSEYYLLGLLESLPMREREKMARASWHIDGD